MLVIADTGPILHFAEAGLLHLTPHLGSIVVPPAVSAELANKLHREGLPTPEWLEVRALDPQDDLLAQSWRRAGLVHQGEAEAIALARAMGADWLLTDDAAARLLAVNLNLEAHGSLGAILWMVGSRILSRAEAEDALNKLERSSLWVTAKVMEEVRKALAQIAN